VASITTRDGRRALQFTGADGKRKTLRLGEISMRDAEIVRGRVELLLQAATLGNAAPPDVLARLQSLGDRAHDKLARAGLVAPRDSSNLGAFLDAYVAMRSDVKDTTATVYGHTRRCLLEYFGADRALRMITAGDAVEWRAWLVSDQGLADNTVRRRISIARQFFAHAVRKGQLAANPFVGIRANVRGNPDRFHFVDRPTANRVLAACPNLEWRLLFALARFGGLRVPSEPLALRWGDVDWSGERFTVHTSKTERHPGKATRVVPMFPELGPWLREAFHEAAPGSVYVFNNPTWRARGGTLNLRSVLLDILARAGVKPWCKLWVNLRATRAVELRQQGFADHVVNAWLGHTAQVAAEHYLRLTDADFARALQNPTQQALALARTAPPQKTASVAKASDCEHLREGAEKCEAGQTYMMGQTGLEPVL